jgi:hypothetical protein
MCRTSCADMPVKCAQAVQTKDVRFRTFKRPAPAASVSFSSSCVEFRWFCVRSPPPTPLLSPALSCSLLYLFRFVLTRSRPVSCCPPALRSDTRSTGARGVRPAPPGVFFVCAILGTGALWYPGTKNEIESSGPKRQPGPMPDGAPMSQTRKQRR